jgi:hypothetical protein
MRASCPAPPAPTAPARWRETGGGAHRQEPTAPLGRVAAAVGIRPAGRLRGRERRRAVVPRSGDALGCWWRGTDGSGCLGQPDGPLRDRVAGAAGESRINRCGVRRWRESRASEMLSHASRLTQRGERYHTLSGSSRPQWPSTIFPRRVRQVRRHVGTNKQRRRRSPDSQ